MQLNKQETHNMLCYNISKACPNLSQTFLTKLNNRSLRVIINNFAADGPVVTTSTIRHYLNFGQCFKWDNFGRTCYTIMKDALEGEP